MIRRRLTGQLLAGPRPGDPTAVAERLLAIQPQDLRRAQLAVRARSVGLSAEAVMRALALDRTLVISWLNRGTLHLVRAEDHPWLLALTAPPLGVGNARRLARRGCRPGQRRRR